MKVSPPTSPERVINDALDIHWEAWDFPAHLPYSQRAMNTFWPTAEIAAPERSIPLRYAASTIDLATIICDEPGSNRKLTLEQLLDWRLRNDALLVMHNNEVVHESYRNGMLPTDKHVNHSTTKSLTTLLVGLAIEEGLVDPAAPITDYLEPFADLPAWRKVSLQHAMDMRTGLAYEEHYADPNSVCWSYFRSTGYYPPNAATYTGFVEWVRNEMATEDCEPGTKFNYASPITNALGMVAEHAYGKSVAELLEEKIYQKIGAESDAWLNLDPSGVAVTEGQLSLRMRDFARWASLFVNNGKNLAGEQVVPKWYIDDIRTYRPELNAAWRRGEYAETLPPEGWYRNQTYVFNAEGSQLGMLGIHGQFAYMDCDQSLMVLGYSSYPTQVDVIMAASMVATWEKIVEAVCQS